MRQKVKKQPEKSENFHSLKVIRPLIAASDENKFDSSETFDEIISHSLNLLAAGIAILSLHW